MEKENKMINITREQFFDFIKTEKDIDGHISKATQHYLDYFDKSQSTGKKGGWNWSAGFFFTIWLFYRKMYAYAIPLLCFNLIFTIFSAQEGFIKSYFLIIKNVFSIESLSTVGRTIILFAYFQLIVTVLAGARYADFLYLRYAQKQITTNKKHQSGANKAVATFAAIAIYAVAWYGQVAGHKAGKDIASQYIQNLSANYTAFTKDIKENLSDYKSKMIELRERTNVTHETPGEYLETKVIYEKKERTATEQQKDLGALVKYIIEIGLKNTSVFQSKINSAGLENFLSPSNILHLDTIEKGLKAIDTYVLIIDEFFKRADDNFATYVVNIVNIAPSTDCTIQVEKFKHDLKIQKEHYEEEASIFRKILNFMHEQVSKNNVTWADDVFNFNDQDAVDEYQRLMSQLNDISAKGDAQFNEHIKKIDGIIN